MLDDRSLITIKAALTTTATALTATATTLTAIVTTLIATAAALTSTATTLTSTSPAVASIEETTVATMVTVGREKEEDKEGKVKEFFFSKQVGVVLERKNKFFLGRK